MKSSRRNFNISIVGAGAVGTTLASMLRRSGNKIVAVVSGSKQSARVCGRLVSCKNSSDDTSIIPASSNLVLIAVPDQSIRSVAESLAALPALPLNRMSVCHTSGASTSDALRAVAAKGAHVFSLHPIQTFPRQKSLKHQVDSMRGITYGVEGPRSSMAVAKELVRQLKGEILFVPKDAKNLYHLTCVLASNYPVALIGAMESVAGKFTRKSLQPFEKLIKTSVENALRLGARKALTGPIVRGDSLLVSEHVNAIQDTGLRTLYKALGAYALRLAVEEDRLTNDQIAALRELLVIKE